jgi:hypothetical protein
MLKNSFKTQNWSIVFGAKVNDGKNDIDFLMSVVQLAIATIMAW